VVTPGDILVQHPDVWPFLELNMDYYRSFARPLPRPISRDPDESLKIDAIYVFNDPRDWGLDSTVVLDLLLSREGILGTLSPKNGDLSLPNNGYLQDGQPPLHFSNSDLWWPAQFHLPRLGQGAFAASLEGLWRAVTGGGVELYKTMVGKPTQVTYAFAERHLLRHRNSLHHEPGPLERVYMVGDNPESDIRGGNSFVSERGTKWPTILVETGIYAGGEPAWKPTVISKDVYEAVRWALVQEGWTTPAL
jgi:HAD superfamily hydrolase (TIGR01456 family)